MSKKGLDLREYLEKSRGDSMHEEFIERVKGGKSHSANGHVLQNTQADSTRQELNIPSYPENVSKPNSLDMLEESLMIAYGARKAAIAQRMQKSKNKIRRSARSTERDTKPRLLDENIDDDGAEENATHISTPPPPAVSKPRHTAKESTKSNSTSSSSPDKSNKSRPISSAFTSLDEQRHDMDAADIFESFKKDLAYWWKTNSTKRTDEDVRGDVADDMTERYLCQRLDPLPASRVVTHIRKSVSQIIERFAETGELPPDISGEVVVEEVIPMTKYAQKKAAEEAALAAAAVEKEKQRKLAVEKSAADRAAVEKKRMKEQYEQYMALKKKAAVHDDNAKEVEIEGHLDDIRSLISSIQGSGGSHAPAPQK